MEISLLLFYEKRQSLNLGATIPGALVYKQWTYGIAMEHPFPLGFNGHRMYTVSDSEKVGYNTICFVV